MNGFNYKKFFIFLKVMALVMFIMAVTLVTRKAVGSEPMYTKDELEHFQDDDERRFFKGCFQDSDAYDKLRGVSRATLTIVCTFARTYGYTVAVHSALRGDGEQLGANVMEHSDFGASRHFIGMALDVSFSSGGTYVVSQRVKILRYRGVLKNWGRFVKGLKLIPLIGMGCYPNQVRPFIHIDLRGFPASWGRIDPTGTNYIAYAACMWWIEDKLKEELL